jgi:hypothetical protein
MRVDFGSNHFSNLQMMWDRKHKSSKTRTAAAGGALWVSFYLDLKCNNYHYIYRWKKHL